VAATVAPSDIGATSSGSTTVDQAIFAAAAKYGVPPEVLFADAQVESGLNPTAVGDGSYGLFQEQEGGELTTIANAENPTYAANLAAQTFKAAQQANPNMTWGQIAAAAQRPANQVGYAQQVNAQLGTAGQMPSVQAAQALGTNVSSNLLKEGTTLAPASPSGGGNVAASGSAPTGNSFETATENAGANPNYGSQLAYYEAGQAAPGISQAQIAEAQALASAGLSPAQIAVGAQNLAVNTGYGLAQDVGNIQGNVLQQQALASQIGTATQQQATEVQQYQAQLQQYGLTGQSLGVTGQSLGSQAGYIQGEEQLSAQAYGNAQGYLSTESDEANQSLANQQSQFSNQQAQLANQSSQIAYEYPLQMQQQEGQAAAAGAYNTVGNREQLANITATNGAGGFQQTALGLQGQEVGLQGAAAVLQNNATQEGLAQQSTQNSLAQQGAQADFGQQYAQVGFSQQQNAISQQQNTLSSQIAQLGQQSELQGYQGQQAQNANAEQQLKLAAQQAGIPVQQAISQLGYGLQQLGVTADPTQFLATAAQSQGTEAQDYAAAISAAAVSGGLGAQSLNPPKG
jgi:Transglycosylase SLT domain